MINYILKKYNNSYLFKLKKLLLGIKAEVIYIVEEESWAIEKNIKIFKNFVILQNYIRNLIMSKMIDEFKEYYKKNNKS